MRVKAGMVIILITTIIVGRKVSYDGAMKSMKLSEAKIRPKKLMKVAMVAIQSI